MIIESRFSVGREQEEILPMDMQSFPYVCRKNQIAWYHGHAVPWHWHNVFEIDYVTEGSLECRTPDQTVILHKGEALFINTGVLHFCKQYGEVPTEYYAQQFDMHLLSGLYNSIFEEKYFLPVSRNHELQFFVVRPDSLNGIHMVEALLRAVEIAREEAEGYEFDLRSTLCDFWKLLYLETKEIRSSVFIRNTADTDRMKRMMAYIHEHYAEKLQLEDIAESAGVSTRECTRCFQRCIQSSPNTYLTGYRIRRAAVLLRETDKNILEISEDCGFSSPSYFGKVFRESTGYSPKDYRVMAARQ